MRRMMRGRAWTSLLLPCLLATLGCVGVWWKAGAGTQELENDKAACRAEAPEEVGFEVCMEDRGWWHSTGPREVPASLGVDGPRSSGAPQQARPSVAPEAQRPVEPSSARSSEAPATAAPGAQSASDPATSATSAMPPAENARARSSPSKVFWKFGESAEQLDRDQAACSDESGFRVEREAGPRWGESIAFDRCMCARGWRGGSC